MPTPDSFNIRIATAADIDVIARHRTAMWAEMGVAPPDVHAALTAAGAGAIAPLLQAGDYVGWVATPAASHREVVASAGVHFRRVLPFPVRRGDGRVDVDPGRFPTVVNVYTEPSHRLRGLARMLMTRVLDWADAGGIPMLALHATPAGRGLYESLGFTPSADMRLDLRDRRH